MMEIKREWFQWFQEEGFDVRADYSGRGMFGKTCFGIVCNVAGLLEFVGYCNDVLAKEEREWITQRPRQDDMGRDVIIYWEHVTVEKEVKNDAT